MREPFNHPKPVLPAHLRRQDELINYAHRALDRALRGDQLGGEVLAAVVEAMPGLLLGRCTEAERVAELEYDRQVRAYNEAVLAYNEPILRERREREIARERAQVRKAMCPKCYCVHAGECV